MTQHNLESLLRSADAAPWSAAPVDLHDRVMAGLNAAPSVESSPSPGGFSGRALSLAAAVAIVAGGLGLLAGAAAWRTVPAGSSLAARSPLPETAVRPVNTAASTTDAPTVLLARAFDDLKPAGSTRLMESMAAPMRSEAQGLAQETRLAARTVLARLPFVSME